MNLSSKKKFLKLNMSQKFQYFNFNNNLYDYKLFSLKIYFQKVVWQKA